MAQRYGWQAGAFEHPLNHTVGHLLALEETVLELDMARRGNSPHQCHHAAAILAGQLANLSPRHLGDSLGGEIQRWTGHLAGLARVPGVDSDKLGRLRALLDQLSRRLAKEWPDYFERLSSDPWLVAYRRRNEHVVEGFHPGPQAWAMLGQKGAGERIGQWLHDLDPIRTTAATGLRLMRDSLQTQGIRCPPEGYDLNLPGEPATGLVRVTGPSGHIPELLPRGTNLRLRFLAPRDLAPATDTVQASLGWFTL